MAHLEAQVITAIAERIENAGSVFMGPYTPESAGDYASGTNHTLPTNGYAKAYSGVNYLAAEELQLHECEDCQHDEERDRVRHLVGVFAVASFQNG